VLLVGLLISYGGTAAKPEQCIKIGEQAAEQTIELLKIY